MTNPLLSDRDVDFLLYEVLDAEGIEWRAYDPTVTEDRETRLLHGDYTEDVLHAAAHKQVPLLEGASVPWRDSILLEYYTDQVFPRTLTMEYQAVRTERYKYIHYVELTGMDELYDLQADPYELENLIGTAPGDRVLPELQAGLAKLQQDTGYRRDFRGYR